MKRDLKASDFSMFWMDLFEAVPLAEAVDDLVPLETLEDPEGPATAVK